MKNGGIAAIFLLRTFRCTYRVSCPKADRTLSVTSHGLL